MRTTRGRLVLVVAVVAVSGVAATGSTFWRPAAAATTVYEAEAATLSGGAAIATDHSGYTGSGFVGGYVDANRGTAATTFTVTVPSAAVYKVTLRYANGTGGPRSLTIAVNGSRVKATTLAATADWNTWGTRGENITLPAGSVRVSYRFDAGNTGNVNLDRLTLSAAPSPSPSTSSGTPQPSPSPSPSGSPPTGVLYEAEQAFRSGGAQLATAASGYTGSGYVNGLTTIGARVIFTVNSPVDATRTVDLRYANGTGATRTLSTYVNGLPTGTASLSATANANSWTAHGQSVALRSGLNTIAFQVNQSDGGEVALDSLTVVGGTAMAERGATVAYTEFEAENLATNAGIIGPDRAYLTVAAEASGRRAVKLATTGAYVEFTLTKPANSIVVRFNIPDSADGAGITAPLSVYANGSHVQDLTLTSKYEWVYGAYPYSNNPGAGGAHRFFDEARAMIGDWPAGTVLRLQKDAADVAAYYTIDLVDTEQVAPAYAMPTNSVSITDFGATANDDSDDSGAINNAISAAKAQGRSVWVPSGAFVITGRIFLADVTIRGAGPWYSVLRGRNGKGGLFGTGGRIQIADLQIAGDVSYRDDANFDTGIDGKWGPGSLIQQVWIEHTKVGVWFDPGSDGVLAIGLRIRDTFADGVNLHGDVRNSRVDQSVVRNTGDDGLAMWSDGQPVTNCAFTFNTVQVPVLANGIGLYAGTDNRAEDNLVFDTVTASSGITISTRFTTLHFGGSTSVRRNTLTRTGGLEPNWNMKLGAVWFFADGADVTGPIVLNDITIVDATYSGVRITGQHTVSGVTLDHVNIAGAGDYGLDIDTGGAGQFTSVTVTGATSGGMSNRAGFTVNRGPGNSGF